jgi:hypothetical protein
MSDPISHQHSRAELIDKWAQITAERLQKSLVKKKIGVTGSLNYSLLYMLKGAAGGDITSIIHEFNYYGRFVDMGAGKGQKIGDVKDNGVMIGIKGESAGRRPKKWYSRTYWAEMNELQELLMIKYGEQAQDIIKENFSIT